MQREAEAQETRRLEAVRSLGLLDTAPEARFDRIVRLAQRHLAAPIVLLGLMDRQRFWLKAREGFIYPELPREETFCKQVVQTDAPLLIHDTHTMAEYTHHPLVVGPLAIRAYAGVPLHTVEGLVVGALVLMSPTPRVWEQEELATLSDLAAWAEYEVQRGQSLPMQERLFRQLVESVHQAFWLTTPDRQRMEYISPMYEKIWGRSCSSLYADPFSFLAAIHPDDRKQIQQAQQNKEEGRYQESYRVVRPDGSVRWVHSRAFPIRNEAGEVVRIAGISEDITEQRAAAAALQQERDFTATILDTLSTGVLVLDRAGRVHRLNRAVEEMTGYTLADFQERPFWELLFLPREQARLRRAFKQLCQSGGGYQIECHWRTKAGELLGIEWSNRALSGEGQQPTYLIATGVNITQRRRAEEEVRYQRDMAIQIMASIGQGLTMTNEEGCLEYVNPAFAHMLGYEPAELIGRTPESLVVERDLEILNIARQDRLTGQQTTYELRLRHRLGHEVYALITGAPRWRKGKVIGAIAAITDLTERRQTERALEESEARFRHLADASLEGIVIHEQGQILDVNRALETMFGYEPGTLIGTNLLQLVAPGERPHVMGLITQQIETQYESVALHASGHLFPVEVSARAMPYQGRMVRVAAIRDITENKRVERALEQQYWEADYARTETRAILDAVGEAILLLAPDRRPHMVNRRFCDFFGVEARDFLNRSSSELRALIDRSFAEPEKVVDLVRAVDASPEEQFTDFLQQSWPQARELALFSTPVRSGGGTYLGRLFVFRDVTHEREGSRMKDEFVSMVSHELRTPLTSIKGFVDLMVAGELGPLTTVQQEYLGLVKNNADRLVALINDLLDLSRIEAGRIELTLSPIVLPPLLEMMVNSLRPQFEGKGQTLVVEIEPELPSIEGDRDRLFQIITNLLSNAHKYTPAGGQIHLTARRVGERVAVAIEDTGVGLSPTEQAQLFTKFFRAHHRDTREVAGTGLGLAITRSLVQLQGGEIQVRSTPGEGSTFTVLFRLAEVTQAGEEGRA